MRVIIFKAMLLLLFTTTAFAQTSPPVTLIAPAPTFIAHPLTAADTVQALHRLFKSRRIDGYILTGSAVIATRIAATSVGTVPAFGFVIIAGGIPAIIGLGKIVRFSVRNEAELVRDVENNRPIPKSIRRKLKPSYFAN